MPTPDASTPATDSTDRPDPVPLHVPTIQIDDDRSATWRRLSSERGEGVISTGIVVLIMALIGAAMWVAFSGTAEDVAEKADDAVQQIGNDDG